MGFQSQPPPVSPLSLLSTLSSLLPPTSNSTPCTPVYLHFPLSGSSPQSFSPCVTSLSFSFISFSSSLSIFNFSLCLSLSPLFLSAHLLSPPLCLYTKDILLCPVFPTLSLFSLSP